MASLKSRFSFWMVFILTVTFITRLADGGEFDGTDLEVKNFCEPDNFHLDNSCSLTCGGNSTSDLRIYTFGFYYYTTDVKDKIKLPITNAPFIDEYHYKIYFLLKDYNAGFYQCQVQLLNTSSGSLSKLMTQQIQIYQSEDEAELGSSCSTRQQCLSLAATCEDSECKCTKLFYITYNAGTSSPACLAPTKMFGSCILDDQCQAVDPQTQCINGFCLHSKPRMSGGDIATIVMSCLAFCLAIAAVVMSVIKVKD